MVPQEELVLRVYRVPYSTNVERVALAAAHKGLEIDWVDVDPADRSVVEEVHGRAAVQVFVQWFNRVWKIAPNRIADEGDDPSLRAEPAASIGLFEGLLAGRDYLFGEFGMADITAFPFLKYAVFGVEQDDVDPFHAILVECLPLRPGSPLRAWVRRVDRHPRA